MTITYAMTSSLLFIGLGLMLADVCYKLKNSEHYKIAVVLIATSMFYVAMDCLWIVVYTAERFDRNAFVILNTLFYLVYITMPYIWLLFAKHFSYSHMNSRRWHITFAIPWFFNLALVILTVLGTDLLWTIGGDSDRYARGPLFGVFTKVNIFYYFLAVIAILYILFTRKDANRRDLLRNLGFALIPALGVTVYTYFISVDAIYPFQPCCFFIGVMFAYILMLSHASQQELEEKIALQDKLLKEEALRDQQKKLITSLASDYWSVYYLELDRNWGECYQSHSDIEGGFRVGETFPYLESVTAYARQYITEQYLDEFLRFIQPDNIREGLKEKPVISYTYMVSRNGRESYEMVRFACVREPGSGDSGKINSVSACFTDVDQETRRKLEQNDALTEALKQAEQANMAKTAFLSSMSHEIRTPMNAIIGLNNIARNDPDTPEKTREYMDKIGASADHLLGIINDILDMSRIESGKMTINNEEFNFAKALEQVNTMILDQCRDKGLSYESPVIGEPDEFYIGDDMKLRQVLINLLGNAVKFTPSGGSVRFTTEKIAEFDDKTTLRFQVSDTGIGMSKEYLPHIFDAFSQEDSSATNKFGSTGLGMPITKNIVELMDGHIDVESEKDKGTTFTVTLTLTKSGNRPGAALAEDLIETPASNDEATHILRGKRILLAEDMPINAEIMIMTLGMKEMEVDHAENGRIAVEKFAEHPAGYYDAVLMDLRMPEMDGLEAARTIRAMDREDAKKIPIIALTANAFDEDVRRSMQAGLNAHLSKPVEAEVLYKTLEDFI